MSDETEDKATARRERQLARSREALRQLEAVAHELGNINPVDGPYGAMYAVKAACCGMEDYIQRIGAGAEGIAAASGASAKSDVPTLSQDPEGILPAALVNEVNLLLRMHWWGREACITGFWALIGDRLGTSAEITRLRWGSAVHAHLIRMGLEMGGYNTPDGRVVVIRTQAHKQ